MFDQPDSPERARSEQIWATFPAPTLTANRFGRSRSDPADRVGLHSGFAAKAGAGRDGTSSGSEL